jgi:hypothetical protein
MGGSWDHQSVYLSVCSPLIPFEAITLIVKFAVSSHFLRLHSGRVLSFINIQMKYSVKLILFCLSTSVFQTGSGAHPDSCTTGIGGPYPEAKARPGRDADHSSPLVPRSRIYTSYISSPPRAFMAWCGTALVNFGFPSISPPGLHTHTSRGRTLGRLVATLHRHGLTPSIGTPPTKYTAH